MICLRGEPLALEKKMLSAERSPQKMGDKLPVKLGDLALLQ
jgi:hypothetical protein